jgi:hypothetical protein
MKYKINRTLRRHQKNICEELQGIKNVSSNLDHKQQTLSHQYACMMSSGSMTNIFFIKNTNDTGKLFSRTVFNFPVTASGTQALTVPPSTFKDITTTMDNAMA